MADPSAAPVVLGHTDVLGGEVKAIAVVDKTAYVALDAAGWSVVDIGAPAAPRVLATMTLPGEYVLGIAAERGRATIGGDADKYGYARKGVIGARNEEQLKQNLGAVGWKSHS